MSYHSAASDLLERCEAAGMTMQVVGDANLLVTPADKITEALRAELRARKPELLKLLSPHVNEQGDLVIPFRSPAKYRWWQGGQGTLDTLAELNAPPELIARHTAADVSGLVEPIGAVRERWELLQKGLLKRPNVPARKSKR